MKLIKQITFNITQSRRIKNYAQKKKIEEKEILKDYQKIMRIIFQAWKQNSEKSEISFKDYFIHIMKYAEIAFRMHERQDQMEKISEHVVILRDALEEYETDYSAVIEIENIVKEKTGRINP